MSQVEEQSEIEQYRALFKELEEKTQKTVGKVIAGPDDEGFYRVQSTDGNDLLVKSSIRHTIIEPETEVVLNSRALISRILNKKLAKKTEKPKFKKISWDDVGGLKSQKDRIRKAIETPMNNKKIFREYGVEPLNGLLLYGDPGVGKTLIAKVIASSIFKDDVPDEAFIYLKCGEILSKYVGESERKIKEIFKQCKDLYERTGIVAVIFLDEAEAILNTRGSRTSSDVDTTIVPCFLAEMDGLSNEGKPFVILATNLKENLDKAVIRPGRIDLHIKITRPIESDAVDIFKIYFSKLLLNKKTNVDELSTMAAELLFQNPKLVREVSGALIKNITQKVSITSIHRFIDSGKEKGITKDDIVNSINEFSI